MLIDRVDELSTDQRLIIAYDNMSLEQAAAMHQQFNDAGLHPIAKANSLATRPGLDAVAAQFDTLDSELMFDPKYHDTDGTMKNYVTECANTDPTPLMVTLHAANGADALAEAVRARDETVGREADILNLLGITVLTSLDDADVRSIFGEGATARSKFVEFAHRSKDAGAQGLVSSAEELYEGYRFVELNGLLRVIPGITLPEAGNLTGQKRIYTPDQAFAEGAHFAVIGRAVTQAENPVAALEQAIELADKEL